MLLRIYLSLVYVINVYSGVDLYFIRLKMLICDQQHGNEQVLKINLNPLVNCKWLMGIKTNEWSIIK